MNNNEIFNPKIQVPKGMNLNDQDYINSLLSTLKEMVKNYSVALTEASNEKLYNEYKEMFLKYSDMQRNVFELMFRKGFYKLEKAENDKISNKLNSLNQKLMDLKD